ncbi:hypothetical protein CEXT_793341 [Caerostris extrusa]|uniref:Uncharacterized protein n=1 Tax=Caerostris extrusa TaxID=172846 RepID=A0AAV4SRD4_CAEEX|nr:hypothetical protein CEXT_793341 [Caerostris extrusa]
MIANESFPLLRTLAILNREKHNQRICPFKSDVDSPSNDMLLIVIRYHFKTEISQEKKETKKGWRITGKRLFHHHQPQRVKFFLFLFMRGPPLIECLTGSSSTQNSFLSGAETKSRAPRAKVASPMDRG